MKKIISLFLVAILLCLNVSALGMRYSFEEVCVEISFPEGYRVMTLENIETCDDLLMELGFTQQAFEKIFEAEAAYAVAYSQDRDSEIWFQVYTTEDSEVVFDMDDFSAEERTNYINTVTSDPMYTFKTADFIDGENGVFFRTERTDGNKNAVTYITIKNGAYYAVTLHKKSDGELSQQQLDDIKEVYQNLTFTEIHDNPNKTSTAKKVLTIICTGLLSAAAFAIAVVVLKRMGYIGKKKNSPAPKRIKIKK